MIEETFNTVREFKRKFPSKYYICSSCGTLTDNPYQCRICENQSTNFILTENLYRYTILETGQTEQIFKPVELEKGTE